jgi:DNA-binding transcriptional regulator YbjK
MPKLNPKMRNKIWCAAVAVAREPGGFWTITRKTVAERAGCAESLVSYYFGSVEELRSSLLQALPQLKG